jgi:hypothetical protein
MIQSDKTKTGFAQPLPHQRYPWDDRSAPNLERYELDWQITPGRDYHGIVMQVLGIYYACIEIRDQMRTTERWARELFQTAAAARAWVQDQLLGQVPSIADPIRIPSTSGD